MLRKHTELINAYNQTIEGWGSALALKEEETADHSQRVTEMTVRIARAMGMKTVLFPHHHSLKPFLLVEHSHKSHSGFTIIEIPHHHTIPRFVFNQRLLS